MVIAESNVALFSAHAYSGYHETARNGIVTSASGKSSGSLAASVSISETSRKISQHMNENKKLLQEKEAETQKMMSERIRTQNSKPISVDNSEQFDVVLIRKMLEALNRIKKHSISNIRDLKSQTQSKSVSMDAMAGIGFSFTNGAAGRNSGLTVIDNRFSRMDVVSEFTAEAETTAFVGDGIVKTADGRSISFNVSFEMSRAFVDQKVGYEKREINLTDPLVINYGGDVAELTDRKFYFDLDADGKKENISFVGQGSGFLALDKDGNGKIDDGNELFGVKSGDGFKDLAEYDSDGNGWIDEADEIFTDLKIWTKDEHGKDKLISLKDADVGAIYLGKASTEFSLNSEQDNSTNGVIRSSGVFLKESGGAGTIQHIDIAL